MTTEQMDDVDAMRAGFKDAEDQRRHRQQQPTLPGMEDQAHELPAPVAVKKPSKKHKKKARSLRDMAFETRQAAQTVMRRDMERGVHKPQKLDSVLADELGTFGDPEIAEEALLLIHEHGAGLQLSLGQWAIVQKLVEAGIVSGRAGS